MNRVINGAAWAWRTEELLGFSGLWLRWKGSESERSASDTGVLQMVLVVALFMDFCVLDTFGQ